MCGSGCSVSKLRVSHTVIPYSFPCCIPLSEIGMDLSPSLFCAGCQLQTMVSTGSRDDQLPEQMYDELVTGDGFGCGFGDGLVMVWRRLKLDILAWIQKQRENMSCCGCDGFVPVQPSRACVRVCACVHAYIKYDKNRHTVTLSVNYEYFQN